MKTELVSVIVPSYRREQELRRALGSLVGQTYPDYEVIVVDDNGEKEWNSRVQAITERFSAEHPQIPLRYIQNGSNRGSAETRNIGIRASRGGYICFLDDDDIYLTDRIRHQVCAMQEANADFSITDLRIYDEHDRLVDVRNRDYIRREEELLKYHLMHHITGTDTIMFRREYLLEIGCFDPINVGDEFYLMTKAIRRGGKFLYVPGCMVKAYVHCDSEGLSSGQGKIDGENALYRYKQQFFSQLDRRSIRYIRMRHHAVLAYAYLRSSRWGHFLGAGIMAVLCEPVAAIKVLTGRTK